MQLISQHHAGGHGDSYVVSLGQFGAGCPLLDARVHGALARLISLDERNDGPVRHRITAAIADRVGLHDGSVSRVSGHMHAETALTWIGSNLLHNTRH